MEFDDIITDIVERTHLSREDTQAAVQVFIDVVTDELKNGGRVSLDDLETYERME